MWRVIVRVEMGGGWYGLYEYRRRASLGMPSKRGVWPRRFRGAAHHGTARKTPQDQLNTPVHWARWTVRQQLTLRRHQARPKPRLGSLCIVSERGHAKGTRSQCPWYWIRSTPTSKSQEFGGLLPRDKRSRHPSHGMPRVDGEPDRGRPVFSGPANWWRKSLAHSSRSKLTARASRCRTPLQAFARASQGSRATHSRSPASASRCSCPSPERKRLARRQARLPATCDCGAHQQLVDPLDARVGSLHPRDERSCHLEFGWSRPHGAKVIGTLPPGGAPL